MSPNEYVARLIEIGRRLYDRGLVVAAEGNVSMRDDDGRIYISASGTCLGRLDPSDIVEIGDFSGVKKPSSEYRVHVTVYENRPDIGAVCHAHPPHATAFAVTGTDFPRPLLPEAVLFVGPVATVGYETPGTEKLAENLKRYLGGHNVFLLKNHGVVTLGQNPEEAFGRMEMVENLARIAYIASALGKTEPLGEDEIRRLEKIGKSLNSDRSADD